ncbi:hypothetical protein [Peptostreptococcus equinus]|uniref:Uncharacterized protein n=1 Tax=Peptostreptococcus equinus TaxID=3003601 RepID=A0ABY7JS30_9FIRM|nr:hypothetical protein [Peptostreptococcus sp. CBA3647]WAW15284.1 hypothetical protein O0R46_02195 [Peptostreptococcus sp. CBA3647]
MRYVAIRQFEDIEDDNTSYVLGTVYPREGVEVDSKRINELSTRNNARGEVLIVPLVELPAKEEKKTTAKSKTASK